MLAKDGTIVKFRRKPDGRLLAPHRGGPPACPDGYERDPKDDYICLPILVPCKHRSIVTGCTGCGGKVTMQCSYFYSEVNWRICAQCKADPKTYGHIK